MMVKPGITQLDKCVDSRYTLVAMTAKRARMIGKEKLENKSVCADKPVSVAVNEIADGKVGYVRSEEIQRARVWEEEKFAAIQHMHDIDYSEEDMEDIEDETEEDELDRDEFDREETEAE